MARARRREGCRSVRAFVSVNRARHRGRFEVVERVLDDLVVGHCATAGGERIAGVVAQRDVEALEDSRPRRVNVREVAHFGEWPAGERADEGGGGFGSSDLDERAEAPVERGGELRADALV